MIKLYYKIHLIKYKWEVKVQMKIKEKHFIFIMI